MVISKNVFRWNSGGTWYFLKGTAKEQQNGLKGYNGIGFEVAEYQWFVTLVLLRWYSKGTTKWAYRVAQRNSKTRDSTLFIRARLKEERIKKIFL